MSSEILCLNHIPKIEITPVTSVFLCKNWVNMGLNLMDVLT